MTPQWEWLAEGQAVVRRAEGPAAAEEVRMLGAAGSRTRRSSKEYIAAAEFRYRRRIVHEEEVPFWIDRRA
ncbi:hypothetical protein ACRAWF_16855 [Streptomyces sp. L7]